MSKRTQAITAGIVLTALSIGVYLLNALAVLPAILITSPMIYTCNGGQIAGITIQNTHDVTVSNCDVIVTNRNGVQVTNSFNVTFSHVNVQSTYAEGSGYNLESTTAGATHDIVIDNAHIYSPSGQGMGWGIAGSAQILRNITVKNTLIEDIGQAGGAQKHGMYVNNWQSSLIDNVVIARSWNSGIKITGATTDLHINRTGIFNSGMNTTSTSGPGISLDNAGITGLVITNSDIEFSKSPAIWTLAKVNGTILTGNYFYNNYYAVEIPSGGTGWQVMNNTGYNQQGYIYARPPVQFDGSSADIANNTFDFNNWYYDGLNPVRIGSSSMSFQAWQLRGQDVHGISQMPQNGTSTPNPTPSPSFTATPSLTTIPTLTLTIPEPTLTPTITRIPDQETITPTWTATFTPTGTKIPFTFTVSPTYTPLIINTWTSTPTPLIQAVTDTITPSPTATAHVIFINGTPFSCPCQIVIP